MLSLKKSMYNIEKLSISTGSFKSYNIIRLEIKEVLKNYVLDILDKIDKKWVSIFIFMVFIIQFLIFQAQIFRIIEKRELLCESATVSEACTHRSTASVLMCLPCSRSIKARYNLRTYSVSISLKPSERRRLRYSCAMSLRGFIVHLHQKRVPAKTSPGYVTV